MLRIYIHTIDHFQVIITTFSLFSLSLVFSCWVLLRGAVISLLWWQPLHSFSFSFSLYCLGVSCLVFVVSYIGFLLSPLWVFSLSLMWVFWFSLMGILILILLQMTKLFRSILKGGTILSSSCNIIHVDLECERCLDIDNLQAKSRDTNR